MRRKGKHGTPKKHRCRFTGKRCYASARLAGMAANSARARGVRVRVYRCDCGWWHMTSQPKR
jgi:hypothetical protein